MARLREHDELRLYLRDHKWWWKWPLIVTTLGVWIGAMLMFVAPWQSNPSSDNVQTAPATTDQRDDGSASGGSDVPDLSSSADVPDLTDAADPTELVDDDTPADTVDEGTAQPLSPEPTTPIADAAEVTEPTEATETRRRTPRTVRQPEPEPIPAPPSPRRSSHLTHQP